MTLNLFVYCVAGLKILSNLTHKRPVLHGLTTPTDDYYIVKTDYLHYGFLELALSRDGTSLKGTFYGNDVNEGSLVLDQFTISK